MVSIAVIPCISFIILHTNYYYHLRSTTMCCLMQSSQVMSLDLICKSAQSAEQISHAQFEQAHMESGSSASIKNNFKDHPLSQDFWIFWKAKVMFVNVNAKAQSKFSALVERRHIKCTEKDQAKKGCTSQGKKHKGSTSPGAKVNGSECNRRQVYRQCQTLWSRQERKSDACSVINNRDSESAVFRIGRSVMTSLSLMRCFTTLTQKLFHYK